MNRSRNLFFALVLILVLPLAAASAVPMLFNYQGTLTDDAGIPLTGPRDLTFRLYPDSAGSAPVLWQEQHLAVPVDQGLFQVMLGSLIALPDTLIPVDTLWLGVAVGTDPEMTPRQQLGSVPWALRAGVADSALVAPVSAHDHDDRYFSETELATPGTINDPANPVDWTKLKSVPAGFADGIDDVGTGGGDDGDWTISGSDLYSAVPGKVGIGTTTPRAKLTIEDDGGVLAAGSLYVGDTLGVNTAGSYLMWYPYKGAFRAGYVYGSGKWNNANIGRYSAAFGNSTKATQEGSFAYGISSEATQFTSMAGGYSANAGGWQAVALGKNVTATGNNSVAIGEYLTASADSSMVIGIGKTNALRLVNNISNSLMVGFNTDKPTLFVGGTNKRVGVNMSTPELTFSIGSNQSNEDGSFLAQGLLNQGPTLTTFHGGEMMMWYPRKAAFRVGELNNDVDWTDANMGLRSVAMGRDVRASGSGSTAIGSYISASGANAMVLGSGIDLNNRLTNGTDNSLLLAFADTAATFFVGGANDRVGVKTRAPQADFDVAGKAQVDSFQLPTGAANGYVLMSNAAGKGSWQPASAVGDNDWTVTGNDMYSNVSGNVGIGTATPAQKLDVDGAIQCDSAYYLKGRGFARMLEGTYTPSLVVGWGAGDSLSGGLESSVYLGYKAGFKNNGFDNTCVGSYAGGNSTVGGGNTFVGAVTGGGASGGNNTYIGYRTGLGTTGDDNVYVGSFLNPTAESEKLRVGHSTNMLLLYGDFADKTLGIGTTDLDATLSLNGAEDSDLLSFEADGADLFTIAAHDNGSDYLTIRSKAENPDTTILTVRADKKVGIGTVTPQARLGINAPEDTELLSLEGGGVDLFAFTVNSGVSSGDNLLIKSKEENPDSTLLVLTGKGRLGLGTRNPTQRLHIREGTSYALVGEPSYFLHTYCEYGNGIFGESRYAPAVRGTSLYDYGIYGVSTDSAGVYGKSTNGIGVKAVSTTNYGLHATSTDQEAVVGISTNDRAVYGKSTNSYSGYFDGSVMVVGVLTKGGGSFLIDHPLDPENKLLRHNFVESPENLLIYRGKVKLDVKGEATVTLPDYFEALTQEDQASIHLTPVGRPFPTGADWNAGFQSFTVYGDANRQVFWEVLADRDDPVIHQLGAPVEEMKTVDSKTCPPGKLLYPTAYGFPESKGMGYEERERLEGGL